MALEIKVLDTVAQAAKDFLQKVITPPLEEVGLLISDQVKLWRFKNQVNILAKAEAHLKSRNLKTRKVSLKVLTPLLENASIEEEESLQEKWAALLANTIKENSALDTTLYSHILGQITITDANLFDFLYRNLVHVVENSENLQIVSHVPRATIFQYGDFENVFPNANVSIDNLIRLRLIKDLYPGMVNESSIKVALTDLGFNFMAVCKFK